MCMEPINLIYIVESIIVILCKKRVTCVLLCYYFGLKRRDCALSLIIVCFVLRVKNVGYLHLKEFWSLLKRNNCYRSRLIMGLSSNNYKRLIYLYKQENGHWLIGVYRVRRCFLQVTTNLLYHFITPLSLLHGYHLRLKKNGNYTNLIMDGGRL